MRFKTNAEQLVGVEKLAVVQMDTAMLTKPYEPLPHLDRDSFLFGEKPASKCYYSRSKFTLLNCDQHLDLPFSRFNVALWHIEKDPGKLLRPFSVAFVKGWRRTLAAFICCEGIRKLQIPLDRVPDAFRRSFFFTKDRLYRINCL